MPFSIDGSPHLLEYFCSFLVSSRSQRRSGWTDTYERGKDGDETIEAGKGEQDPEVSPSVVKVDIEGSVELISDRKLCSKVSAKDAQERRGDEPGSIGRRWSREGLGCTRRREKRTRLPILGKFGL